MGTRSLVGYYDAETGAVKASYVHYDGYVKGGVGQITIPTQGASFTSFSWGSFAGDFPMPEDVAALQNAQFNLKIGMVPIGFIGGSHSGPHLGAHLTAAGARAVIADMRALKSTVVALRGY